MILNKYSEVKKDGIIIGSYSSTKSSSSSSSSSSNKSGGLDREIWGQDDDGGDLNGDLTCEGNMFIVDNWDDNENDEDDLDDYIGATRKIEPVMKLSIADDLSSKFDNDEGGNLYIKRQLIVDKNISTPECYGKSIFLDYPEIDNKKTNLLDLLKDFDSSISINKSNIANLTTRIDNAETNISLNTTNIANNTSEITKLWEEINNINSGSGEVEVPTKVSQLENDVPYLTKDDLPENDKQQPKILFSGVLQSNNDDKTLTFQPFTVFSMNSSQYEGLKELTIEYVSSTVPALKIGVVPKDGYIVRATSSTASVLSAADGANNNNFVVSSFTAGEKRSSGYWTVGGTEYDGYSYWYAGRTGNEHSDAAHFDVMAKRVKRLSITIFGIGYKV